MNETLIIEIKVIQQRTMSVPKIIQIVIQEVLDE